MLATLKSSDQVVCYVGNAPTLMSLKSLRKVAPTWMNVSKAIFDDKEAHEVWHEHIFSPLSTFR